MLDINFKPFPLIQTDRLLLRRVIESDVNEMFFLRSDERVLKYIERDPAKSTDEALQFIKMINEFEKNNESILWAITFKNDSRLIGTICYWNINKQDYRAEIGYVLHPDFWGKGIMQEVMEAVIDYGFNKMQLHSIEARVNPGNIASIKLLEKNNFVREAYFRENYFYNGKFMDTAIYSLLKNKMK